MQFEPVIPLLIKQGADVNARDKQGKTPTQIAIELGSSEALDALFAASALDTECYDKQGTTMLIG
jgi:ankyrin repeat protein